MIDIVAAFLMGFLEEDIFIELPIYFREYMSEIGEPLANDKDYVIQLMRTQYGLVQSARAWFKRLCAILEKQGVKRSKSDPCLFYKHDEDGNLVFLMPTYVDDTQAQGVPDIVEEVIKGLEQEVKVKQIPVMETFLLVNYHFGVNDAGFFQLTEMREYI